MPEISSVAIVAADCFFTVSSVTGDVGKMPVPPVVVEDELSCFVGTSLAAWYGGEKIVSDGSQCGVESCWAAAWGSPQAVPFALGTAHP